MKVDFVDFETNFLACRPSNQVDFDNKSQFEG